MDTVYEDINMENYDGVMGDGAANQEELIGTVINCKTLNIREEPTTGSSIVTTVRMSDEVKIDIENPIDDWYLISTSTGAIGYCMKKFISIEE